MDELKPCPFCNKLENLDFFLKDNVLQDNGRWIIRCLSCIVSMELPYLLGNYSKGDKIEMRNLIVKTWNKRNEVSRKSTTNKNNNKVK